MGVQHNIHTTHHSLWKVYNCGSTHARLVIAYRAHSLPHALSLFLPLSITRTLSVFSAQ